MIGIKFLAFIWTGFIALVMACLVRGLVEKIKEHFAYRCPKCKTAHKTYDRYCRMCGYELGGYSGWRKREEEKCRNKD